MRAARSADTEKTQMLLDKGADAKLANKDGLNALMLASGVSWADKDPRNGSGGPGSRETVYGERSGRQDRDGKRAIRLCTEPPTAARTRS
jgi:hypothetical protein